MSAAMPPVVKEIEPLRPADSQNWIAPSQHTKGTTQEVNLLDMPNEDFGKGAGVI